MFVANFCAFQKQALPALIVLCIARGLRTAMLEKGDFGGQTSSKSTKLVHGGVRYLEKAVFNLDYGQLKLVFEALHERKHLIENAPHLSQSLPIMTVSPPALSSTNLSAYARHSRTLNSTPLSAASILLANKEQGTKTVRGEMAVSNLMHV